MEAETPDGARATPLRPDPPSSTPAAASRPLLIPVIALAAVLARLLQLQGLHPLVWDEIEFFRATDWVRRGLVPYRDFWEHHTPLQWFLFAPFTALTHSPGASAIILMRWIQLPLWVAAFLMMRRWMRDAGVSSFAARSAITLVLCSTLFMLPAVEYRVDVLGCVVYLAALVLLQRMSEGRRFAFFGGAMLCLSGLANLRLGPLAVVTLLLVRVLRTRERSWGGNTRANWSFAGAAAAFVPAAVYFAVTHSAHIAWQRLWVDNFLADRFASTVDWMFVHRMIIVFGIRLIDSAPNFQLSQVDPGGIAILVIGAIGIVRALRYGFRAPGDAFSLSVLQITNILFIAAMKFVYNYHLEIVVLLMMPLVAMEIDRWFVSPSRRRALAAFLLVAASVNIAAAVFRGKEADTQYEDFVMRESDRLMAAGTRDWDGAGWVLHHDPSYPYWFLRENVFVMEEHGYFAPYTTADVLRDPPPLIVADVSVDRWLASHRPFAAFILSHYLPRWREIWLPGMSARLTPLSPVARWVVLADGTYDVYASARLASHPWFRQPFDFDRPVWSGVRPPSVDDRGAQISWSVDGVPVVPAARFTLHRGQRVDAISGEPGPVGIMLIGAQNDQVFCQPVRWVKLEASEPPQWHVPDLGTLAGIARGRTTISPREPCRR